MKRVILFPGSFSPFTDGHYALINRYLAYANDNNKKVDEVKILMSSSVRDGIDPNIVFKFVQQLYSNDNRINVSLSGKSGPVRECFEIAGNTENLGTTYVFMRSNKDHDDVADSFYKGLSKGGKYYIDGISVEKFDVNLDPVVYNTRKDENNKKPISATIARKDLENKDFESFKSNYYLIMKNEPSITEKHVKLLFDSLCNPQKEK